MSLAQIREVFLWSAILNYAVLLLWWGMFTLAHDRQYRLVRRLLGRSFRLSVEQMDTLQFTGMMFYKLAIWLFLIIPCIALHIAR